MRTLSHNRKMKALFLSSEIGTPTAPNTSINSYSVREEDAFNLSLETKTDTELVLYLPWQWICCQPKLFLNRNFKETRRSPGNILTAQQSTCSLTICGLIKSNSLLTVIIHLLFNVTVTLQLKVLVNGS